MPNVCCFNGFCSGILRKASCGPKDETCRRVRFIPVSQLAGEIQVVAHTPPPQNFSRLDVHFNSVPGYLVEEHNCCLSCFACCSDASKALKDCLGCLAIPCAICAMLSLLSGAGGFSGPPLCCDDEPTRRRFRFTPVPQISGSAQTDLPPSTSSQLQSPQGQHAPSAPPQPNQI